LIFWDLDGPILDVSEKYYYVYRDILTGFNQRTLTKNEFWNYKRSKKSLFDILSKTNSEKLLNKFSELWIKNIETYKYQKLDRLQNGALEILSKISNDNELVMVTLRRNRQRLLEQLDELNLKHYFKSILSSGEDLKPRWKIKFNLINEYLLNSHNHNHMIIGDTETDIVAGNNLGFYTIGLLCGIRNKKLIDSKPDKLLNETLELMDFFS